MISGDEHMAAKVGLMGLGPRPAQASSLAERVLWTSGDAGQWGSGGGEEGWR